MFPGKAWILSVGRFVTARSEAPPEQTRRQGSWGLPAFLDQHHCAPAETHTGRVSERAGAILLGNRPPSSPVAHPQELTAVAGSFWRLYLSISLEVQEGDHFEAE